jgi:DNA-binding NtrC family response regulator
VLRLATAALAEFNSQRDAPTGGFSPEALKLIEGYRWPGNVRELHKEVERAVTMAGKETILPRHFSDRVRDAADVPVRGPRSLAEAAAPGGRQYDGRAQARRLDLR